MEVIIRDPVYLPADQVGGDILDLSGGDAAIDRAGLDLGAFEHYGARRDDGITADLGVVHNNGAHADEHLVLQGAAMYDRVMAYGNIVADHGLRLLIGAMDHRAILNIDLIADPNTIDVAAYHGIEPDAAIIPHDHVADHGGIRRDEAIFTKLGGFSFDGKNDSHATNVRSLSLMNANPNANAGKDVRSLFLQHVAQTSPAPLGLEIVRAEGIYLYDNAGKEYIDLIGGISVCNTGHRHPRVVKAIKDQADQYLHLLVYGELIQSPQVQYAAALAARLPSTLNSVYFTNSGAEATEGAMKLAKRLTGRPEIVAFRQSYHGSTQGALSVMGDEYWRNAFRPLLPGIYHEEYNSAAALDRITERTACVIAETVQGERGVVAPQTAWLQALRAKCDAMGALLVLDEIQTGFGRTGSLWGFTAYGVIPDILLLGKALGGGMPLGAFIADREKMWALTGGPVLGHITTFGGHPVCCAAGLASLDVLLEEGWIGQVAGKEALFRRLLVHPSIRAVRSCGLLIALEFGTADKNRQVIDACIQQGLLTDWFLFAPDCMRIAPPLCITEEQIEKACAIIMGCI